MTLNSQVLSTSLGPIRTIPAEIGRAGMDIFGLICLMSESSKVYLLKEVNEVNRTGAFVSYKRSCNRVASIVKEMRTTKLYLFETFDCNLLFSNQR